MALCLVFVRLFRFNILCVFWFSLGYFVIVWGILSLLCLFVMVALCNKETIYIFMLWFVLLSSFFPRLISAAADWMSAILPHMVWL